MRNTKINWLTPIAVLIALSACTSTATSSPSPDVSPTAASVSIAQSGKCSDLKTRSDVLLAAYDSWLSDLTFLASISNLETNLRKYLENESAMPPELQLSTVKSVETANSKFREAIIQPLSVGWPLLVPEEVSVWKLVEDNQIKALVAAQSSATSGNAYLRALAILDGFPAYGNSVKGFIARFCE